MDAKNAHHARIVAIVSTVQIAQTALAWSEALALRDTDLQKTKTGSYYSL
jgi:hypothetical protein